MIIHEERAETQKGKRWQWESPVNRSVITRIDFLHVWCWLLVLGRFTVISSLFDDNQMQSITCTWREPKLEYANKDGNEERAEKQTDDDEESPQKIIL